MNSFIIYALGFRLAIIAVGALAIYLGYRLFVLGVMPKVGTNVEAGSSGMRLSIKNAAPGTIFAVFGLAMITTMLIQGNPEYNISQKDGKAIITIRGGDMDGKLDLTQDQLAEIDRHTQIILENNLIQKRAANPLLDIARIYYSQRWYDNAMALTNLVITLKPENINEADQLKSKIIKARGY